MTKSGMSILLVAMMAFSGFSAAQGVGVKSGNDGGAGPTGASGMGDKGTSVKSRAEVKADRNIKDIQSGTQGGEGTSAGASSGVAKKQTAAERKAQRAESRAARKARLSSSTTNTNIKSGTSAN